MNAQQRRQFRRALDRMYPAGTLVTVDHDEPLGFARVLPKYRRAIPVAVIRARRGCFERAEYNRVLVENTPNPFGHISLHWSRVKRAPQHIINKYLEELKAIQAVA